MIRLLIFLALIPGGTGSDERSSDHRVVRGAGSSNRAQYVDKIELGQKELIYTDSQIPIRYDGSLSTIKRDDSTMFFFH